jgi:hypothetical protein
MKEIYKWLKDKINYIININVRILFNLEEILFAELNRRDIKKK